MWAADKLHVINTASQFSRPCKLPPLILHPFADKTSPAKILESSRASLMLQGLLENGGLTEQELEILLLDGRMCEVRMLFYIGRDVMRWVDQCCDFTRRQGMGGRGFEWQSFAGLLIEDPPEAVKEKLKRWGVADYRKIFGRAIGLNAVFSEAPERLQLTDEFVRNYHSFADQLFQCRFNSGKFEPIALVDFEFDLFASGEYSRILEREWEEA